MSPRFSYYAIFSLFLCILNENQQKLLEKANEVFLLKPMLLTEALDIPEGDEWLYETKYDGFRCLLEWVEQPMLISRNGNNLNHLFPEIIAFCQHISDQVRPFLPLLLDGELVYLINNYKSEFSIVQKKEGGCKTKG